MARTGQREMVQLSGVVGAGELRHETRVEGVLARDLGGWQVESLYPSPVTSATTASSTPAQPVAEAPLAWDRGETGVPTRVMIVGDSITQGSSGDYTWRFRLSRKLASTAPGTVDLVGAWNTLFDPVGQTWNSTFYGDLSFADREHSATWGSSWHEQAGLIAGKMAQSTPDVVVALLGTNDVRDGRSPEEIAGLARTFVEQARSVNPGVAIVIGEVLHRQNLWTGQAEGEAQSVKATEALHDLATSMTTDTSPIVMAPTRRSWDPAVQTYDGTHPNPTGENLLAQRMSEALAALGIGTALPDVATAQSWRVPAPRPTVVKVADRSVVISWSRVSTGSTGMIIRLRELSGRWVELPFPVADSFTLTPEQAGCYLGVSLRPVKVTMAGAPGTEVRYAVPHMQGPVSYSVRRS